MFLGGIVRIYIQADLDLDILTSIPIILRRRDGHAAWINDRVIAILRRNGVDLNQVNVDGGEVVRDPGLGVLLDNAMDLAGKCNGHHSIYVDSVCCRFLSVYVTRFYLLIIFIFPWNISIM